MSNGDFSDSIQRLVAAALPRLRGEDVIDDVFCAIEARPDWRQQYDWLCAEERLPSVRRGESTVNSAIGRTVRVELGRPRKIRAGCTARNGLTKTYSKLDVRGRETAQ